MINLTDLSECEISLPGDWVRQDNHDTWSFTPGNMEMKDQRLYKRLDIRHPAGGPAESHQYALAIKDDFCAVLVDKEEFIICELVKNGNGPAYMELENHAGLRIRFERSAGA